MKEKLTIVKVGGAVVEDPAQLGALLDGFCRIGGRKALVHGGGRRATQVASRLGIESRMVGGRRITDEAMLEVVTMVYAGLVNKNIVAGLQALGVNALGMTGADMNILLSDKRPVGEVDYGYVGDVRRVDAAALSALIEMGVVPVIAPLTHDGQGSMLNTNADTMAGETAKALASRYEVSLVYCFEKRGVLRDENDDNSVIAEMTRQQFETYRAEGVVQGGMIPKLENAFDAIRHGVREVIITRADAVGQPHEGTRIVE